MSHYLKSFYYLLHSKKKKTFNIACQRDIKINVLSIIFDSPFFLINNIYLTFFSILQMTRAQLKKAGKLMRNVCQPKNKVTNG